MTTVKTALGGRIPRVNLDQGSSVPGGFVLKLPDKFRPTYVTDSLRQTVVFDHILDVQTLDTYDLVFAYESRRELVLIVSSPICNLLMDASNFETSLVSVLRPFFLLRMPSLCLRQVLFIFGEELGIAVGMPIGGDDHRFQPQIKPYRLRGDLQWLDVLFHQDGDKVAVRLVFGDCDTAWLASIRQRAVPDSGKRGVHLRKGESMPVPGKRIACIGSGLLVTLLFEGGIVSAPFKEIAECFLEMAQGLLEGNRRHLIEPHRFCLLLESDQALCCSFVGQTLTILIVHISPLSQCPVIDVAATSEGLRQYACLFISWVEAVLVGFLLFHALEHSACTVQCQTVSQPRVRVIPLANNVKFDGHPNLSRPLPKVGPSIPRLKDGGFTGRSIIAANEAARPTLDTPLYHATLVTC